MNLLHYEVKFSAKSAHTVTVHYRQYAFADTRDSGSYQLAYVLHPATLWKDFGPINLTLSVPKGVASRASAATELAGTKKEKRGGNAVESYPDQITLSNAESYRANIYRTILAKPEQKRGELFVAVDKAAWDKAFVPQKSNAPAVQQRQQSQR